MKINSVLLITIDSLRADHLGCYGYKRNTSPNVDKLGRRGILFTQAIAQSSHTPISMGSILTSTMACRHLLLRWGDSLNPRTPNITEVLKSKGYTTVFIGGDENCQKGLHGFTKGFDLSHIQSYDSGKITNEVIELLQEYAHKPIFIWAHYMNAHYPYIPSKPYENLFINDELYSEQKILPLIKPQPNLYGYGFLGILESLAKEKGNITNPDYYISQYDAAIRTVDEEIGRIVKNLMEKKLDKRTIIIITSDHGEMLGEHNYYFFHGYFLYEPLVKIPLVIKYDEIIPQNKVIDAQISAHLDIMPTILDILEINKVKTMEGISLLPIIMEENKCLSPYVFVDEGISAKCIRTKEWKLIYTDRKEKKEYELYNLKEDPQELNNLIFIEKEKFKFLKRKLDSYKQAPFRNKPILDEETKNSLRSLGYV